MDTPTMQRYLEEIESEPFARKFDIFYELLCFYNQKYNLTRITERNECKIKHFFDSICAELYFPPNACVIEIGSGAGFPSIPLKIVRNDLSFTLVESVGKKCDFLREAIRELALENVRVVNKRAEDCGKDPFFREQFDVCCARAVARLNTLAEYCVPLIRKNGLFIAYKGDLGEELAEAGHAFAVLGAKQTACIEYDLPQGMGKRSLLVAEKIANTPSAYPRGNGKERSKPL